MQSKHFLIPLWVFVTNNIVNSEHEMSIEISLRYMVPPVPVSKYQPRKTSICPSHPHYSSAAHDISQILLVFVTAIFHFLVSYITVKFFKYTRAWVWGPPVLPLHILRYLTVLLIMASLSPFSKILWHFHYDDVIMGAIASQITILTIVYSAVYSGADQSKHQSSASLAFVWGIHRGPVNPPHKWPVTRKMFPFDDVIM